MIERSIGEGQRACIGNLEGDSRIAVVAHCALDIGRRDIDPTNCADPSPLRERETQVACAATDVQRVFIRLDAGEVDEEWREATAPSPHLQFVSIAVRRHERGQSRYSCCFLACGGRSHRAAAFGVCAASEGYCAFSPIALTSAASLEISFSTNAAKSAGVMDIGSKPSAISLSRTLGACSALSVSL